MIEYYRLVLNFIPVDIWDGIMLLVHSHKFQCKDKYRLYHT
jgi:hypothetical protein